MDIQPAAQICIYLVFKVLRPIEHKEKLMAPLNLKRIAMHMNMRIINSNSWESQILFNILNIAKGARHACHRKRIVKFSDFP